MSFLGDYIVGQTLDFFFTTRRFTTGAPFTLAGTPVISAYEDNSVTEITAGITLTVDFDARTGLNHVRVVASGANGFEAGKSYAMVITTGTVDSVSVVGEVVGNFTLERSAAFARLGAPAGASVSADVAAIQSDTDNIQTRLPAALVSGRIDASVGAMAADVVTAAAIANGAIDAATFAAGAIDAAAIATDAIGSAELAASAVDEIVNAVLDELTSEARTAGSYGQLLKDNLDAAISSRATSAQATAIQADTDDIQTRLPASLVSGRMDSSVGAMVASVLAEIADTLLNRDMATGTDSGSSIVRTVRQALRALRNRAAIAAGTLTVYKEDDVTASWTGAVSTAAGNPISEINPAGP